METIDKSRRAFIIKIVLLIGSFGLLNRFLRPQISKQRKILVSVKKEDIPISGALVYREARLALMRRDDDQPYALSLLCTHLGCLVTVNEEKISCPCHGSEFDLQGNVLKGPAERPLRRFLVEERDGVIEVVG
jgi:Rieske Fe-S protein